MKASRIEHISSKLIEAMGADNDTNFKPTELQNGIMYRWVREMIGSGCVFSDEDILDIVTGERTEVMNKYAKYCGFKELDKILNVIFNGE